MFKYLISFIFTASIIFTAEAQVINAYAKLTGQAGDDFTVSIVNQTFHSFVVGENAIIMQMQDDVIGANTNNNSSFGDISNIANAGYYEIREITSINGNTTPGFSAGAITQITLNGTVGSYNFGPNSSVQLISFRQMSTGNYTSTSNMSALDWDGDIGGVIALDIPGTFTLNHSISADQSGFRGGSRSVNRSGPTCVPANSNRYRENNDELGFKGEGLYKNTASLYNNGRGKITNGGGGGSHHNGGGAGGGNYTTGGIGGNGWNTCTANPAGGLGGLELSSYIAVNRIFMGGGGGGGQQNNTQSRDGGNGGGIVLIKADEITTSACSGVSVSANGTGPLTNGGNDGGGGGGAGGSIVFEVNNWNITSGCPLNVSANGGDGSSSLSGGSHAGGGAGAQGVIIYNTAPPTTNITSETLNGSAGCGNTSNPCNSLAGSATGADNSGILSFGSPLPVELTHFDVEKASNHSALIHWTTALERNNDYFTLEKSSTGSNFKAVATIEGAGNSVEKIDYTFEDHFPFEGISYYRLKQTDFDGTTSYSSVKSIVFDVESTAVVFPNPNRQGNFEVKSTIEIQSITIMTSEGRVIDVKENIFSNEYKNTISLKSGMYFVQIKGSDNNVVNKRIMVY
jgi:hypothetical protein